MARLGKRTNDRFTPRGAFRRPRGLLSDWEPMDAGTVFLSGESARGEVIGQESPNGHHLRVSLGELHDYHNSDKLLLQEITHRMALRRRAALDRLIDEALNRGISVDEVSRATIEGIRAWSKERAA